MVSRKKFGTADGRDVFIYRIVNSSDAYIEVLDYGCTIVSVCVPDKNGDLTDVCLGYESLEEYIENDGYLGMLVGRCANRISKGRFSIGGKEYALAVNNGPNHLHGGIRGFSSKVFDCEYSGNTLRFSSVAADGEEGYPGNMSLVAEYSFTDKNEIILNYKAVSDAQTVINITNHAYYDLNGQGSGRAMEQKIKIDSDYFAEIDETSIPTGVIRKPEPGDPFYFGEFKSASADIDADDPQLDIGNGYDHCFAVSGEVCADYGVYGLKHAAEVIGDSGIRMDIYTTKPGMQMYTANFLTERNGKNGAFYYPRSGIAFETQHFPDAVNHPEFPTPVVGPLEIYNHVTIYKFSSASAER